MLHCIGKSAATTSGWLTTWLDTYCFPLLRRSFANKFFEALWRWAKLEFAICATDVFECSLASNTAKDNAIQERVATKPVVAVHSACDLTSRIQSRNHPRLGDDFSIGCDLETAHAIVDHGSDDCHIERFFGNP